MLFSLPLVQSNSVFLRSKPAEEAMRHHAAAELAANAFSFKVVFFTERYWAVLRVSILSKGR